MSGPHTLNPEWLLSLAAGTLSPAYRVVVESYLDQRTQEKQALRAMEELGGVLLEEQAPETVSGDLLQQTLDLLTEPESPRGQTAPAPTDPAMPASLQAYLGQPLSAVKWSFLGPGLQKCLLWKGGNDERLWLLKGKANAGIPAHSHQGPELNLVLAGGYHNNGQGFGPGDIEEGDGDDTHQLTMDPGEDCICLAATQGPLVIHNWPGRLLQPFLGI
jgi:putative transcriptional regulator